VRTAEENRAAFHQLLEQLERIERSRVSALPSPARG